MIQRQRTPNMEVHYFSLLEVLISVSIMVTLSGVVGISYNRKIVDAKIARTTVSLVLLQQAISLYHHRNGTYPLSIPDLIDSKDIPYEYKDGWDRSFVFVPHIEWNTVLEFVSKHSSENFDPKETIRNERIRYNTAALNSMKHILSVLPESIDPTDVICASWRGPFVFSWGHQEPVLPEGVFDLRDEQKAEILNLIRKVAEKAVNNPIIKTSVESILKYLPS